MMENVTGNWTK